MIDFLADPEANAAWLDWGGAETLISYGVTDTLRGAPKDLAEALGAAMPKGHRDFLMALKLTYEAGDYFFAHAGVKPGRPLAAQREEDLLWIREEFHKAPPAMRPNKVIVHGHHPATHPVDAGWRIGIDTGAVWSGVLTALVLDGADRRFLST